MSLFKGVVYLTQAQYDALSSKDPDTLYVVNDKVIPVPKVANAGSVLGVNSSGNFAFTNAEEVIVSTTQPTASNYKIWIEI